MSRNMVSQIIGRLILTLTLAVAAQNTQADIVRDETANVLILQPVSCQNVVFSNESLPLSPREVFSVALRRASAALASVALPSSSSSASFSSSSPLSSSSSTNLSVVSCSMSVWSSSSAASGAAMATTTTTAGAASAVLVHRLSGSSAARSVVSGVGPESAQWWREQDVMVVQRSSTAQEVVVSTNVSLVDASSGTLVVVRLVQEVLCVVHPNILFLESDFQPSVFEAGFGEVMSVKSDPSGILYASVGGLLDNFWFVNTEFRDLNCSSVISASRGGSNMSRQPDFGNRKCTFQSDLSSWDDQTVFTSREGYSGALLVSVVYIFTGKVSAARIEVVTSMIMYGRPSAKEVLPVSLSISGQEGHDLSIMSDEIDTLISSVFVDPRYKRTFVFLVASVGTDFNLTSSNASSVVMRPMDKYFSGHASVALQAVLEGYDTNATTSVPHAGLTQFKALQNVTVNVTTDVFLALIANPPEIRANQTPAIANSDTAYLLSVDSINLLDLDGSENLSIALSWTAESNALIFLNGEQLLTFNSTEEGQFYELNPAQYNLSSGVLSATEIVIVPASVNFTQLLEMTIHAFAQEMFYTSEVLPDMVKATSTATFSLTWTSDQAVQIVEPLELWYEAMEAATFELDFDLVLDSVTEHLDVSNNSLVFGECKFAWNGMQLALLDEGKLTMVPLIAFAIHAADDETELVESHANCNIVHIIHVALSENFNGRAFVDVSIPASNVLLQDSEDVRFLVMARLNFAVAPVADLVNLAASTYRSDLGLSELFTLEMTNFDRWIEQNFAERPEVVTIRVRVEPEDAVAEIDVSNDIWSSLAEDEIERSFFALTDLLRDEVSTITISSPPNYSGNATVTIQFYAMESNILEFQDLSEAVEESLIASSVSVHEQVFNVRWHRAQPPILALSHTGVSVFEDEPAMISISEIGLSWEDQVDPSAYVTMALLLPRDSNVFIQTNSTASVFTETLDDIVFDVIDVAAGVQSISVYAGLYHARLLHGVVRATTRAFNSISTTEILYAIEFKPVAVEPVMRVAVDSLSVHEDDQINMSIAVLRTKFSQSYRIALFYPTILTESVREEFGNVTCFGELNYQVGISSCLLQLEHQETSEEILSLASVVTPRRKLSGNFTFEVAVVTFTEDVDPNAFFASECFSSAASTRNIQACILSEMEKSICVSGEVFAGFVFPQAEAPHVVITSEQFEIAENGTAYVALSNLALLDLDGSETISVDLVCKGSALATVSVGGSEVNSSIGDVAVENATQSADYQRFNIANLSASRDSVPSATMLQLTPVPFLSGTIDCTIQVMAVDQAETTTSSDLFVVPFEIIVVPVDSTPTLSTPDTNLLYREADVIVIKSIEASLIDRDGSEELFVIFSFANSSVIIEYILWEVGTSNDTSESTTDWIPLVRNGTNFFLAGGGHNDLLGSAHIRVVSGYSGEFQFQIMAISAESDLQPSSCSGELSAFDGGKSTVGAEVMIDIQVIVAPVCNTPQLLLNPTSAVTKPLQMVTLHMYGSTDDQDGSETIGAAVYFNTTAIDSTTHICTDNSTEEMCELTIAPADPIFTLEYDLQLAPRADFVGFFTVTVVVWTTELETGERVAVSQVATVVVVPIDPVVQPTRVVHGHENAFVRLPLRRLDTSTEVVSREHLLLYVPDKTQVSDVYAGLHRVPALAADLGSVAVYAIPYALRSAISIRAHEYLVGFVRVYFVLSTVPFKFELGQSAFQDSGDGIAMEELSVVVHPVLVEPSVVFAESDSAAVYVSSKPVVAGAFGQAALDADGERTIGGMWASLLVSPSLVVDAVWSNETVAVSHVEAGDDRWFDAYQTTISSVDVDWSVALGISSGYSGTLSSRMQLTALDVAKQSFVSSYVDVRYAVVGEAEVAMLDVGDGVSSGSASSSNTTMRRTFEIGDDQNVSLWFSDLGLASGVADLSSISIYAPRGLVDFVFVNGSAVKSTVSSEDGVVPYDDIVYRVFDISASGCGNVTKCSLDSLVTILPRKFLVQKFSFSVKMRSAIPLIESGFQCLTSVSTLETFQIVVRPVPNAPVLALNATEIMTQEDTPAEFLILSACLLDTDGSEVIEIGLSFDPFFVSAVRVNSSLVSVSTSGIAMIASRDLKAASISTGFISILPRLNFGGKFAVDVFVRSIEQVTGDSIQVSQRVNVTVNSVADPPVLNVRTLEYRVNQNLVCEVTVASVALVDTDGSEALQLIVNDTKSLAIDGIVTSSGIVLQRMSNGIFNLSSLPAATTSLILRFTPVANWFGSAQITLSAIATESDGTALSAVTAQTIALNFTPTADKPIIAVESIRQSFGKWGKIGLANVTLPVPAKANTTRISIYLQPRAPAYLQVMSQSTLLQLESIPSVSASDLYRVPKDADLSALVARSSDKTVDVIVFDVIVIAAIDASKTSQQESKSTNLTFVAIQLSATTFTLKEGANESVTVRLLSAPMAAVSISIATSMATKATISPATVTFSQSNWNSSRVLQIAAVNNFLENANQIVTLTSAVVTTDALYASYSVDPIVVLVVNDDFSGIALYQKVVTTAPALVSAEGRVFSGEYSIVLLAEPTADVRITITANLTQLVLVPAFIVFTPLTWNVSQTIVVNADDNLVREGDHYGALTHTVSTTDKIYATKTIDSLRVTVVETKDTTPPPTLQSVKFLATGVGLAVQFDRSVNRAPFKDNTFLCSVVFDLPTAQSATNYFGVTPSCSWQTNDASIRFMFGRGVNVVPGSALSLRGGLLKSTVEAELSTPAVSIIIAAPDSPPVPVALVSGARSLGTCDDLFLDGSSSSGSGGRTMTFKWMLIGSTNTIISVNAMNAVLAATTTANNASLRIAAAVMEEDSTYQIILQVQNFFGMASNSSTITVKKAAMPLPVVSIRGGGKQDTLRAKELIIAAGAENPTCSAPSADGSTTASTSVDMTFSWTQLQGDLTVAQFKSTSPNPRIMKLPSRTLTVGVKYVFQIFVAMAKNAKINNTASVEVNVLPSSVSAMISGGDRSYGVEQDLVLDASKSVDPDDTNNAVPFAYSWGCIQKSTTTGLFDTSCVTVDNTPLVLAQQAQTTIAANTVNPNQYYNFTVTVKKGTKSSSASVVYFFKPGSPPGVSIEPLAVAKVNINDRVLLKGSVTSKLPVKKTEWTISGLTQAEQATVFAVPALGRRTMLLKEYSLTPGISYKFQLYVEDSAGQSATATISVIANSPPSSGLLVVTPVKGFALDDTFTCTASNWVDEDSPLKYTYKYIKGSAYSGLEEISMGPASLNPYFSSIFTQGSGDNNTITVVVYVQDSLGAVARAYQEITVEEQVVAAEDQAAYLANKTNAVLADALSGDPSKVMNMISALGDLINGPDETTTTPTTTPTPSTGSTPTTQVKLKSCPTRTSADCSSDGDCIRKPADCSETDISCITTCSCWSGYYGDNCAMDKTQFEAKQKVLGSLISAMATSAKSIDLTDVGAMEQQAASIATLTKSASVLDSASQALALNFVDSIMSAPVLTKSATTAVASTISNLLDVDSSPLTPPTPTTSTTPVPTARRLTSADVGGSSSVDSVGSATGSSGSSGSSGSTANAGNAGSGASDPNEKAKKRLAGLQNTIGKLESVLLSSSVAGEEPVTLVSKNLKIVATRDYVSQLEGKEIKIPLSDAEIAANYTPPSAKVPEGFASFLANSSSQFQSAGSGSNGDGSSDPTIDIQSIVYTKNPYSFDGTAINSRVMSVKVRRDGEDVAVQGLTTPFRIMMRNADPVFAPAAGTSQVAQNFTFYCVKGTIDTKFFDCTGLNSPISVECNGTEFNGQVTCPVREPACRYWDTTNSSWSSEGCVVAGTTDDGQYTICECMHLTDFSTDVQQSLKLVTEHFDRVIHHVVTVEDLKKNVALLVVIGVFFIAYLVGFFYVSRWDYQDTLRFKREKRMKLQQTEKIKIRSLFQEPEFLHAVGFKAKVKAAANGFWRGLKENHKLMSIVFKYNEHFSRAQRLTIIFTVIMSQMFTNALLYQLKKGPKSTGSAFVAGVISSLCMIPVTIAFIAMFKKAARRQNYLVRYHVEDDEGNVAEVETDAYGNPREYSPNEILSMDLAAIANCVTIARIQKVADELKNKGVDSKVGQLCRGIFVALYNRDANEEPPELDEDETGEHDPLKGILVQIKSHLQADLQQKPRRDLSVSPKSRLDSFIPFGKKRKSDAAATRLDVSSGTQNVEHAVAESSVSHEIIGSGNGAVLSDAERRTLAMNQMLLMLGREGGEAVVNDMLKFDPLQVSVSSAAKIAETFKFVDGATEEQDEDDEEESEAVEVMLTLQDWLAKCNESCVAQQTNTKLVVAKARLELQRTESQLKKLKYAIGAQFERRISEAIARAELALPENLRGPDAGAADSAHRQSVMSKDGVVVQLPADRKRSTRRMSRLSSRQQRRKQTQGPTGASLVDRKLSATIKMEKKAILKANSDAIKEKRAAMKDAQGNLMAEQRKLRKEAKREMQKLYAGMQGVTKMKKKLQLYLEAREKKRIDALPLHERQAYLVEKEQLKKIKRTSRVLYNQFLRRQPARVSKPLFPEWVIYISYAICFGWSVWSAFFVIMFGFTIGQVESQLWVSSLLTGIAMTHVVSDPLKIFFRMGLMPIVAAGVLAESGLFNALGSETLALGAVAAVGASGVAQYMTKREERKRIKRGKTNRLVPTDQKVYVQALQIAGRVESDDEDEKQNAGKQEVEDFSDDHKVSSKRGSFTDISRVGVRDAVFANQQSEQEKRLKIEAELEADLRDEEEKRSAKMPKLVVTKRPPMQLIQPASVVAASPSSSIAKVKTLEQESSAVLKGKTSIVSEFGPSTSVRKPPPSSTGSAVVKPSHVAVSNAASDVSKSPVRGSVVAAATVTHLCPCGESIREQDWTVHQQDVCSHRMVQCRAGCGMFLEARSRNGHELSQCRLVMCNCGKMVLTKSLELHQQRDCRNKTAFCRLNCGASMPSHQRERHERHECALRVTTCVHCGFLRHAADMNAHLANECQLQRAKATVSSAISAYATSPTASSASASANTPKLNVAAIRGPPIQSFQPGDATSSSKTKQAVAMPLVVPPGGIVDSEISPEKQKLAAMREKVLARKAQQQASTASASASITGTQPTQAVGPSSSDLVSSSLSSSYLQEEARGRPGVARETRETKLSPIRRKMMSGPPPIPGALTAVLSPREDEVLAASLVESSTTITIGTIIGSGGEGDGREGAAAAAAHGVGDQLEEIGSLFFDSGGDETKSSTAATKDKRRS